MFVNNVYNKYLEIVAIYTRISLIFGQALVNLKPCESIIVRAVFKACRMLASINLIAEDSFFESSSFIRITYIPLVNI